MQFFAASTSSLRAVALYNEKREPIFVQAQMGIGKQQEKSHAILRCKQLIMHGS